VTQETVPALQVQIPESNPSPTEDKKKKKKKKHKPDQVNTAKCEEMNYSINSIS
jgi:hypothetical protein